MREWWGPLGRRVESWLPVHFRLVEGSCLHPVVRDGDVILLRSLRSRDVEIGDLVTADANAFALVKRVVAIDAQHVDLQGDALRMRVDRGSLTGRVIAAAPSSEPWRWRRIGTDRAARGKR